MINPNTKKKSPQLRMLTDLLPEEVVEEMEKTDQALPEVEVKEEEVVEEEADQEKSMLQRMIEEAGTIKHAETLEVEEVVLMTKERRVVESM